MYPPKVIPEMGTELLFVRAIAELAVRVITPALNRVTLSAQVTSPPAQQRWGW